KRDPRLFPTGWDAITSAVGQVPEEQLSTLQREKLRLGTLDHPTDAVIYELHIRDFSVSDPTVPPPLRGTFLAFADEWTRDDLSESGIEEGKHIYKAGESLGMKHLKALSAAGLNYIHLLPSFDFASVDERLVAR